MATLLGSLSGNYKTTYNIYWELLSQSIENNTSTIRLTATLYTGNSTTISSSYSTFTLDGETVYSGAYSKSGAGDVFSRTKDIVVTHNSDGTFPNRSVSYSANDYIMGNKSGSATITGIATIPRQANITNAPDFNDEQNPTITYSNPAGNAVSSLQACISFTGSADDIKYRDISKTGTSYTFNLTDEERKILRANTVSNNRTIRFYVKTVIGGNTFYSFLTKTFSIINANPTFNNFDFEDVNPITTALTSNIKVVILNYSNIKATISEINKATANKEATMVKYRFGTEDIPYSSTGSVSGIVNKINTGVITVYAIDSRENSTPVIKNANKIIEYTPLSSRSIQASRENGVSENVILNFSGNIDLVNFGKVQNSIKSAKYRYTVSGQENWSDYENITVSVNEDGRFSFNQLIKGDTPTLGFNQNNSYLIEVVVEDELSIVTFTASLSSGIPHIAYAKNGVAIMGKYDESVGGLLQVGGKKIA